jgi:hypothetical protein
MMLVCFKGKSEIEQSYHMIYLVYAWQEINRANTNQGINELTWVGNLGSKIFTNTLVNNTIQCDTPYDMHPNFSKSPNF